MVKLLGILGTIWSHVKLVFFGEIHQFDEANWRNTKNWVFCFGFIINYSEFNSGPAVLWGLLIDFHDYIFNWDQLWSTMINHYPLVNVYITMERSTMLSMGKLTISMAIFNSKLLVITRPGSSFVLHRRGTVDNCGWGSQSFHWKSSLQESAPWQWNMAYDSYDSVDVFHGFWRVFKYD